MKRILLVGVVFVASEARADGCFVDFFRPNQCSGEEIRCAGNPNSNLVNYGVSVAGLCASWLEIIDKRNEYLEGWQTCYAEGQALTEDYNKLVHDHNRHLNNWKACGTTVEQIRGAIGYWEGLTHYYEGLTARLRAKCGKKCRGIQ